MSGTKILLVDDHKIVRKALKLFLNNTKDCFVIQEASSGKEALEKIQNQTYDLIITDINMPLMNGIELCIQILKINPHAKVLALSMMNDNVNIKKMLQAGATGYLLKDCDEQEFLMAVKTVLNGDSYYSRGVKQVVMESISLEKKPQKTSVLSKREKEILYLLFREYSNGEIADKLFISQRTVETHKRNIMEKTGSKNLAGLVKYAMKHDLYTDLFQY